MSRNLKIGAPVEIEVSGRKTLHTVIARKLSDTPSGVAYRLLPSIESEWIDAMYVRKADGFGNAADPLSDPFAGYST